MRRNDNAIVAEKKGGNGIEESASLLSEKVSSFIVGRA